MTDTGHITRDMLDAMEGAAIVLLESNHDIELLKNGRYPYYLKKRILSGKEHLANEARRERRRESWQSEACGGFSWGI